MATTLTRPRSTAATALPSTRRSAWRGPQLALLLVGLLFFTTELLLVPRPMGLSTDEATYLAMVDPRIPELYWTAPRARGVALLAAPVAAFSVGTPVLRLYLDGLASSGLVLAFWPWLRVLRPAVAPLAALLFSTVWVTQYYGSQLMPNLYVALGAVGTIGMLIRAVQQPAWWRLGVVAAGAALVALVRPSDSVLVLGPVVVAALAVPRLRRIRPSAAVVLGVALGWLPWVVEAYDRFGGPLARLRKAETAGPHGIGLDLSRLTLVPRMLDGTPVYCCQDGPVTAAGSVPLLLSGWLAALLVLAVLGLVLATRHRRLPELLLLCLPAGVLGVFYVLLPSFTTLRFLLPVFAMLSLPVASALVGVLAAARGRSRLAVVAVLVLGLAAHLTLMVPTAERLLHQNAKTQRREERMAAALRPLVAGRPCLIAGTARRTTSAYLGCSVYSGRPKPQAPKRVRRAEARGAVVVWLLNRRPPATSSIASWRPVRPAGLPRGWTVYLPPR